MYSSERPATSLLPPLSLLLRIPLTPPSTTDPTPNARAVYVSYQVAENPTAQCPPPNRTVYRNGYANRETDRRYRATVRWAFDEDSACGHYHHGGQRPSLAVTIRRRLDRRSKQTTDYLETMRFGDEPNDHKLMIAATYAAVVKHSLTHTSVDHCYCSHRSHCCPTWYVHHSHRSPHHHRPPMPHWLHHNRNQR